MARRKQKLGRKYGEVAALAKQVDEYVAQHKTTPSQAIVQLGINLDLKAYRQFQYRQRKANGGIQHFPIEAIPDRPSKMVRAPKPKNDDKDIAMLLLEAATRLLKR